MYNIVMSQTQKDTHNQSNQGMEQVWICSDCGTVWDEAECKLCSLTPV